METIFWCISSHTEEPPQASVTATTITTMTTTPRKAMKRNANRQRKSQRALRGAPRYYVRGVLVAHCHRCNITHPMGQHLPSITTRLTLPDIRKAIGHSPPARPNSNPPEQEKNPSFDQQPPRRPTLWETKRGGEGDKRYFYPFLWTIPGDTARNTFGFDCPKRRQSFLISQTGQTIKNTRQQKKQKTRNNQHD